jgi:hypothetical protein
MAEDPRPPREFTAWTTPRRAARERRRTGLAGDTRHYTA